MTNYNLYRARVEGKRSENNRFLCRILPDMTDIGETDNLPDYPVFLQTDQVAYRPGDVVWVLCDEDYQIGYIIGPCEPSIGSGFEPFLRRINDAEKLAQLPLSAPENLTFSQVMDVAIEFSNRNNKQSGRILVNGTVILFGFDGSIFVKNPQAIISLSKEGNISIKSKALSQDVTNMDVKATAVKEAFNTLATTIDGNAKISVGGTHTVVSSGNRLESVLGTHDISVIGKKRETIGEGVRTRIISGGSSTLAVVGNIDMKAIAGSVNLEGTTAINITGGVVTIAGGVLNLRVSQINAGPGLAGVVPVLGPFCSIPICPMTMLPHCSPTFTQVDPTIPLQVAAELLTLPPV